MYNEPNDRSTIEALKVDMRMSRSPYLYNGELVIDYIDNVYTAMSK